MEFDGSRRGITTAALAAVVVVVVVAGIGLAFIVQGSGSTGGTTATSGSSSVTSSSSATSSSATGLLLSVEVNSTSLAHGQGLAATVEDTNTHSTPLNISSATDWPSSHLAVGVCGTLNEPIGLEILQGNYDLANASSGAALQLYSPGLYPCPAIFAGVETYVFQPMSDNATIYGTCTSSGVCTNETVSATVGVDGYYSGTSFVIFPAGVYTVVAGDEWGDIAVAHFSVG